MKNYWLSEYKNEDPEDQSPEEEPEDDGESTEHTDAEASNSEAGKKKKKKKATKKADPNNTTDKIPLRVLGEWKADAHPMQTTYPPTIAMTK